jgi:hypothetical protein
MADDHVDPHAYRSGTKGALFEMARGTCHYPGCETPTIVFVKEGQPSINVQVAHIEGAEKGSARYNESMTNEERRSYPNLLLLCIPHHDLVDNKEPDQYTVELLRKWKASRELATTGADAEELHSIREETLAAAMEAAIKSSRRVRQAIVEVSSATVLKGGAGALVVPLGQYPRVSQDREAEKAVALIVRATGDLSVMVHGISIYCRIDGDPNSETKLMGRDDYIGINPRLPARVDAGDAKTWLTAVSTFAMMHRTIASAGREITHFRYDVDLGTGDVLKSDVYDMDVLLAEA